MDNQTGFNKSNEYSKYAYTGYGTGGFKQQGAMEKNCVTLTRTGGRENLWEVGVIE